MADVEIFVSDSEGAAGGQEGAAGRNFSFARGALAPATVRALRLILVSFRFILEEKVTTSLGADGESLLKLHELSGESGRGGLQAALRAKREEGRLDCNTHGLSGMDFLTQLLFLNRAGNVGAHLQSFNDMLDRGALSDLLSKALKALKTLHTQDALCVKRVAATLPTRQQHSIELTQQHTHAHLLLRGPVCTAL
jgi:hypothetical protein